VRAARDGSEPRLQPTIARHRAQLRVDVAAGSLGVGLPVGVGIALSGKKLEQLPYRVWVLCGNSELAEGSVWEAFARAAHAQLDNLIAIVDVNRLGQSGETMLGWNLDAYPERARAFGWRALVIDGHRGNLGAKRARDLRRRSQYLEGMALGRPGFDDRVSERRRAVTLARHFREAEGLSIAQIAERLGRSPSTIKAYFYDQS
jgi:hypothetical protein